MRTRDRIAMVAVGIAALVVVAGTSGDGDEPTPVAAPATATASAAPEGESSAAPASPATAPPTSPDTTPAAIPSTSAPADPSSRATGDGAGATGAGASTASAAPRDTAADGQSARVVSVADGDTLTVVVGGERERVRVIGIDTPEMGQCGADPARSALVAAAGDRVRLSADPTQADRDRFGRLLRHVELADGRQAAQVLIRAGHGREYTYDRHYRHRDAYLSAQRSARSEGLGVWGSACAGAQPFAAPAPARTPAAPAPSRAPSRAAAAPKATGSCDIKGNINNKGEKIYHVPGGRSYEKTVITPSKGERWFCSESDARAAGWRAARG